MVMQPGNYKLDMPLEIYGPHTTILGLGMATLIATNGIACIEIVESIGVRIAGLIC